MQGLAYSTYCSLKYPSRQGCLSQESHFTIAWQTCGAWNPCRELTREQTLVL